MYARLIKFIPKGSIVLACTTLGSYVAGLLRDRMLAQTFGASTILDSYNAAFLVPDFLFNVLVASGIAAAGVPIFTRLYSEANRRYAYEYMNALLLSAVGTMIMVSILLFLFAPVISSIVAPGLSSENKELVARLMRILAFSPLFFAASNALGAMLVAKRRFFWYGMSPVLYNVGIIIGVLTLAPRMGIMGVAYGALGGAALHMSARLLDALVSGWRFSINSWPAQDMKKTVRLMIPKMFGHPVELVTFWVFTTMASTLSAGSITVLNLARNFQSVPVSLIGIAMSTAIFPLLSHTAASSTTELKDVFRRTAIGIVGASTLAALVLYVIRTPLVRILLGGGEFTSDDVARTALILGVFCLSIPTEAISHLLARTFYAAQNTITPVLFSIVNLVIAAGSAYLLMQSIGLLGLPLGYFLGSLVKCLGLYMVLAKRKYSLSPQS